MIFAWVIAPFPFLHYSIPMPTPPQSWWWKNNFTGSDRNDGWEQLPLPLLRRVKFNMRHDEGGKLMFLLTDVCNKLLMFLFTDTLQHLFWLSIPHEMSVWLYCLLKTLYNQYTEYMHIYMYIYVITYTYMYNHFASLVYSPCWQFWSERSSVWRWPYSLVQQTYVWLSSHEFVVLRSMPHTAPLTSELSTRRIH